MNALLTELARLYSADPQHAPLHDATRSPLIDAHGQVRCAVLELARPADWQALGGLWRGVQSALELPAPGIAINGHDGYQLWFSWQQPIAHSEAQAFVEALCTRFLAGVAPARLRCWPGPTDAPAQPPGEGEFPAPVPRMHPRSGQWSSYIAPDLAAVFADEPWLDRDPGVEAQAQLLARLECIGPEAFAKAQQALQAVATPLSAAEATSPVESATAPAHPEPSGAPYPAQTPNSFLHAVMQDAQAPLALRVQAAVALLGREGC